MKIYIKNCLVFLTILILFLTLSGCSDHSKTKLNDKVYEELKYLDLEIISLINYVNNITIENYKLSTKEISLGESTSGSSPGSIETSSSKESSSGSNSTSSSNSSSSSKEGSGSEGSGSEGNSSKDSTSSGNTSQEKITITELVSKNVLGSDKETNWELLKSRVENIYSVWSTISIDLTELNISQDIINLFNTRLNEVALNIEKEDKVESINKLADLYESILTLYYNVNGTMSENDKKLKEIKYNSLIAYKNVEKDNFQEAKTFIENAQEINNDILNNLTNTNEHNIKKVNIMLNQIYSSLDMENKDIFYINYKNLIEELNLM